MENFNIADFEDNAFMSLGKLLGVNQLTLFIVNEIDEIDDKLECPTLSASQFAYLHGKKDALNEVRTYFNEHKNEILGK